MFKKIDLTVFGNAYVRKFKAQSILISHINEKGKKGKNWFVWNTGNFLGEFKTLKAAKEFVS